MYSSRTGQCQGYNNLTSLSAPFVKRSCFEPAFLTPMNDSNSDEPKTFYDSHVNIKNNDRNCGYDTAYGNNIYNPITPMKLAPFDSRNSIWRRENSVIVGYAPRNYKSPTGRMCPQQPYVVVDETNVPKVVCPVLTSANSQPQCNTCMTTVFQCERFREVDPVAFQKCNEYQRMIHYNIVTPDGSLIPAAAEIDGPGFDVFDAAVQKCGVACASCAVNYPAQNFKSPQYRGPTY